MKVEVSMSGNELFEVNHWWAKEHTHVVRTLQAQLEAAQSIWPELRVYKIRKSRQRKLAKDEGRS